MDSDLKFTVTAESHKSITELLDESKILAASIAVEWLKAAEGGGPMDGKIQLARAALDLLSYANSR